MQHWRNLLQLVTLFAAFATVAQDRSGNIQGIPTPWIYQLSANSSFDAFDKYLVGSLLNNLNKSDAASLGARFVKPYVARQAAFGVLVDDTLTSYSPPVLLNGLSGGDNWPPIQYVEHETFPALTWDTLTNSSYTVGTLWTGSNGGTNNNLSTICFWKGPVVGHLADPLFTITNSVGACHWVISGVDMSVSGTTMFLSWDSQPINFTCSGGGCTVGSCTGLFDLTSTNTFIFFRPGTGCDSSKNIFGAVNNGNPNFTVNIQYTNSFGEVSAIFSSLQHCP